MRALASLKALVRGEIPLRKLDPLRRTGIDAYELVDELPRGPARLAAWNAYALRTYGDKLVAAGQTDDYVSVDTATLAQTTYQLAAVCLERAQLLAEQPAPATPTDLPRGLPHWHTPIRSEEQLVGMRETLEALRTYIAFDLGSFAPDDPSTTSWREGLAAVDAKLATVDGFWIARPPEELRGGIGDALITGLDQAYVLGQLLANPKALTSASHASSERQELP
jgi:hypothetical protein